MGPARLPLSTTFKVGRFTCHALEAGRQHLDGGAMFGVVPKVLWARRAPADDRNRIPLALRCLLIEHDDGLVLIDTGIGNKENEKFIGIYGVDNAGQDGRTKQEELAFARHTNERTAGRYLAHNFQGVPFQLIDGETEILPGIHGLPTPGHVPYHQSILIASGGEKACFIADLVPTAAHLPLPWIMGYDLQPLVTLETRRRIYQRAEAEGWLLVFEHDPHIVSGRLAREDKGFGLVEQQVLG